MGNGRVRISTGFLVLLGVLFYLDDGLGLLGPGLAACLFHELGHILAIRAAGGRIRRLELTVVGAALVLDPSRPLSYGRELAIALAGPLVSFLCAWISARAGAFLLAGMSLGQGAFNLLPVFPLDGGRALYAGLSALGDGGTAERVLTAASAVAVGLLFGLGLILLRRYENPTLVITSGWLLAGVLGSKGRNGGKGRKK